jgi:hypothetical protein
MDIKSKISINRITDNHLITEFIYNILLGNQFAGSVNFNSVSILVHGAPFTISKDDVNSESGKVDKVDFLEGKNSESINEITLNVEGGSFSFSYVRGSSGFVDEIIVKTKPHDSYGSAPAYVLNSSDARVLSKINETLIRYSSPNISEGVSHDVVLAKLEGISADLISKQHEHLRRIEEDKQKHLEESQRFLMEKIKELEQKYLDKESALSNIYEEKNSELSEREKRIIDEDNTTARRITTRELLKSVIARAERFSFSSGVNVRGYLIVFLCAILGLFGIFNAYEASVLLSKLPQTQSSLTLEPYIFSVTDWFNVGKAVTGSILFITSVLYLMKWMNQWANKIADIELDYQKFSRDLNRADLTIEMCLEWSDKKDGEIPNVLLSSLTSGIFTDAEYKTAGEINHPVEQLAAALIKSAEKIELPLGSGKITTTGKSLSKS